MNKLSLEQRTAVAKALLDGNSIRATVRMTGVAKNTVVKLLADLGNACARYQWDNVRDLDCRRLQVDEIWSFCYAKEKNVPAGHQGEFGFGDLYTYVALDPQSKLVACWLVGRRLRADATIFMQDLASRLKHRVQLTTDGYRAYIEAVANAFGEQVDFAQLVKMYAPEGGKTPERRYSPSVCTGAKPMPIVGSPEPRHISTSMVERQNLTMRMFMRRFTRLTNGFSKKVENHIHAVALHFMWYNFGRVHGTLGVTPAFAAGLTDHRWTVEEVIGLIDSQRD
jgi:IS1 family transposase